MSKEDLVNKLIKTNNDELLHCEQTSVLAKAAAISAKNLLDEETEMLYLLESLLTDDIPNSLSKDFIKDNIDKEKSYIKDYQIQFEALDKRSLSLELELENLRKNILNLNELLQSLIKQ